MPVQPPGEAQASEEIIERQQLKPIEQFEEQNEQQRQAYTEKLSHICRLWQEGRCTNGDKLHRDAAPTGKADVESEPEPAL